MDKDLRKLAKRARDQGWTVELNRNKHVVFTSPAGHPIVTGSSASDHRSIRNLTAIMRRHGYKTSK